MKHTQQYFTCFLHIYNLSALHEFSSWKRECLFWTEVTQHTAAELPSCRFWLNPSTGILGSLAFLMWCLFIEVLSPSVRSLLLFYHCSRCRLEQWIQLRERVSPVRQHIDVPGGILSSLCVCPGSRGYRQQRERLGGGTSFIELDWEQTGGQQADREERLHGDSNQRSLEAPTQECWVLLVERSKHSLRRKMKEYRIKIQVVWKCTL